MNYPQLLLKIFLLIVNVLLIKGDHHKHSGHNYGSFYSKLSTITYDYLGNCYVEAAHHKGRCIRYQECESAVKAWQKYQQFPISCYYTSYENYVCCPEAFVKSKKRKSTTPSPPPIPYYLYYNNPFYAKASSVNLVQEERISEKECASIYTNLGNQYTVQHQHRSKRNANSTDPLLSVDDAQEPVQEETIKRVKVVESQAVGGIPTYANEFPYMCALGWRKFSSKNSEVSYNCGCVLIARKYVLTAAHCATLGGESPSIVRLGGVDLDKPGAEIIKIQRIIQHPDYESQLAYNDIAIVKLQKGSSYTPACLWTKVGLPQQTLTAMGYGHTKFAGPISNTLLKVYLNVLTNQNCNPYYTKEDKLKNGISLGQICAGDPQGKMDTCQGDSGGPLIMKESKYNTQVPFIVGLTSFGEGCATNIPSVYTRISFNKVNTQFSILKYNQAQNNILPTNFYNIGQNFQTIQYTTIPNPITQNQFTFSNNVQNQNVLNSNQRNRGTVNYQTLQYNNSPNLNPIIQSQITFANNVPNQNIITTNQRKQQYSVNTIRNPASVQPQGRALGRPSTTSVVRPQQYANNGNTIRNPASVQPQGRALGRPSSTSAVSPQQYANNGNTIRNPGSVQPQGRALGRPPATSAVSPQQYANIAVANRNSNTPIFKSRFSADDNNDGKSTQPSAQTFKYQYSKGWSVHEALSVDDLVKPQLAYRKYSNYSTPNAPDDQYYQKFYNIYNYEENQGRQDLIQYEMESVNDDFNGRSIVAPGQYPHMAAIGFLSNEEKIDFKCGGSLISHTFVITAAHCCYLSGETPIIVKLGIINLKDQTGNSNPQRRAIKEIIVHPKYNATMTYHDIALLKLQKPVEFTKFVRPILLWTSDHIPYERVFTMGYGSTSFAKAPTNILTELSLSLIPLQQCKQTLPRNEKTPLGIVETQICGRDLEKNRDTCQGDSGGPLQLNLEHRKHRNTYRYYLVGIISYGEFCGSKQPGVYTRVSSYCKWIASIVWPEYFQK
ncbi:uncharacterized protein LOC135953576 [Calliphora vicina]|uniref:uncharacterized protein LOC135953576 n=1 Tax=Calliphora vicina TaxID=7373 RepID=UPI00325BB52C